MEQRYQHAAYDDDDDYPARLPAQPRKRPTPKRPPVNATQQRREVLRQMEDRAKAEEMRAARQKREEALGGRGSLRYHTSEAARLNELALSMPEPVASLIRACANDNMNKVRELRGQPTVETQRRGMEYADAFRR